MQGGWRHRRRTTGRAVWALLAGLLLPSCYTHYVCDQDTDSYLLVGFRHIVEGEVADSTLADVTVYGIRENRADSLILNVRDVSKMSLPLNPHADISRFVIEQDGQLDTLTVNHNNAVYLLSYSCGFATRFQLLDVVCTMDTDSLVILNPNVDVKYETNLETEHLLLYL
ncbi:MAG: DUF6452 family protein [Bacteroidales bacterium]